MLEEIHKISSEECEEVFNVLNVIFINIKLGLLIDSFEIINQIENCMNKLDVIQKQNILKELKQTYQDDLFKQYYQCIELIIMNNLKQKINENYEEQYEQYKQQKDQRKLLQLFQQEQFWQYIPQNIKIIQPILMKIEKERFFEILEFIDYSQNKIKKSQISILKSLFNIKYIQQNLLNNKEQRLLEQFIGSLLFKQLHEFENYIEYYQNKDIILQIQYKQVQNRQNIQELQIFPTLFQLLTQDFKEQQYLDIYLQKKLSCINFNENPQQLLEDYIRTDNDIDEVYFKIVIYFWGIYCSQLINLGDSIRKQLPIKDNIKNKAIQAIQQSDFIQSEIQLYFFDRFIYFNENFQFQNKFYYDQQKSNKIQILNQIQLFLDNYNQIEQLSQIQSQFIKLWEDIQELGFFQINLIIYQNEKIKNLIKFLWITNIQQNHTDIIQMIFQNNQLKNDLNSLFRILINSKIKDNRILIQDLICLNLILQNLTIDYYKIYKITPILLNHYYQNIQYPSQMNIDLESFQIQFDQINNQNNNNNILDEWIQNMNNKDCFIKLLPFYFDIIQKGESIENFTLSIQDSFERLQIPSKYLNMKALFQILYNNSNNELKMILIKQYSQYYPIPFLYQNLKLDKFDSELDLFKLNHLIFYLFPKCYPIISFSLSNKQKKYGKTTLINEIFYQEKKFEISDNCELNNDTIDIMFDFCFNDQRKLAIADIHGQIPIKVLIKILPLFHLWIIQLKTEDELEENYINLQQILQQLNQIIPQICFIIRDSKRKINNQQQEYIKKIQNNQMEIVFIINLNDENIDYQIKIQETRKIQNFIYSLIFEENYDQFKQQRERKLKKQTDFLYLIQDFNTQNEIELIKNHQILIQNLKKELNDIQKNEEKCYLSSKAFPIRSLLYDISNLKAEINQLSIGVPLFKEKKQKIDQLQEQIKSQKLSCIIEIFFQILMASNFYLDLQVLNNYVYLKNKKSSEKIAQSCLKIMQENYSKQNFKEQEKVCNKLKKSYIGIELFWREIIKQSMNIFNQKELNNLVNIIYFIIKIGEPFELLDLDNFQMNEEFFKHLFSLFSKNNEKVLVLSTLGPCGSGKSTLINKIFGTRFQNNTPTKGIVFQLLKVQNNFFKADYILLLDNEGLSTLSLKSLDYYKQLVLLILAVSDIILIIFKGKIEDWIKNLISSCLDTLKLISHTNISSKQMIWCCNQNGSMNNVFSEIFDHCQFSLSERKNSTQQVINSIILNFSLFTNEININNKWYYKKLEKLCQNNFENLVQVIQNIQKEKKSFKTLLSPIQSTMKNIKMMPDLLEQKVAQLDDKNCETQDLIFKYWLDVRKKAVEDLNTFFSQEIKKNYQFISMNYLEERINELKNELKTELIGIRNTQNISDQIYSQNLVQIDSLIQYDFLNLKIVFEKMIQKCSIQKHIKLFSQTKMNFFLNLSFEGYLRAIDNPTEIQSKFEEVWGKSLDLQKNELISQISPDLQEWIYMQLQVFKDCNFSFESLKKQISYIFKFIANAELSEEAEKAKIFSDLLKGQLSQFNFFIVFPKVNECSQYIDAFCNNQKEIQMILDKDSVLVTDFFDIDENNFIVEQTATIEYLNNDFFQDLKNILAEEIEIKESTIKQYFELFDFLEINYKNLYFYNFIQTIQQDSDYIISLQEFKQQSGEFQILLKKQKFIEKIEVNEIFLSHFKKYYISLPFYTLSEFVNNYQQIKSRSSYLLFSNGSLFKPKSQSIEDLLIFSHSINPQENIDLFNQFKEIFPNHFHQIMLKSNNGWYKIFCQIYDLIKKYFCDDNQQIYDLQQINLNYEILCKIQLKINDFNQQIARLGIILNEIGQRFIKQYSLTLISRFQHNYNVKFIKEMQLNDSQIKNKQFDAFKQEFLDNFDQQSFETAQKFINNLILDFKSEYSLKNRQSVCDQLRGKILPNFKLIEQLDEMFFIQMSFTEEDILDYILNQPTYITKYVLKKKNELLHEILSYHVREFNKLVIQNFEHIVINIGTLENSLFSNQINDTDAEIFFTLKNKNCQIQLFEILIQYLEGREPDLLEKILNNYRQIFNPKHCNRIILPKKFTKHKDKVNQYQIKQLKPFLKELKKYLNQFNQQQRQLSIDIEDFQVQNEIDNFLITMAGCQETCPLCRRKCDQNCLVQANQQQLVKHACQNGHQVIINQYIINEENLNFTFCQDVQRDDLVSINQKQRVRWEQFQDIYSQWDFQIGKHHEYPYNAIRNFWENKVSAQMKQKIQCDILLK